MVLIAVAAPLIAPQDPNASDLSSALSGPSGSHLLGVDGSGRDVFSRLVIGSRTALFDPLAVVVVSTVLGVAVGVAAGWRGGWLDTLLSRSSELLLALAPQHPYTSLLLESVPRPGWDPRRIAEARRALA